MICSICNNNLSILFSSSCVYKIGVQGHFIPLFEAEKAKLQDTMWISCEFWNEEARSSLVGGLLQKGKTIKGIGTMIMNKWIDKTNGEERKKYILRITHLLSQDSFSDMKQNISNIKE